MTETTTYKDLLKMSEQITFIICCLLQKRQVPLMLMRVTPTEWAREGAGPLRQLLRRCELAIAPQSTLKGEMATYTNKEFTPFMFIFHPGLPQDLVLSVSNKES